MSIHSPTFDLENFKGPVDLLLYLIQKSEIDIYDIRLQQIMHQFIESFPGLEETKVESGSEFLSYASTLLLLKSQKLLPVTEANAEIEESDPRFSTIQQLLEYCRFKEAAAFLTAREEGTLGVWARGAPAPLPAEEDGWGLSQVQLEDLLAAFEDSLSRAPREIGAFHLKEEWKVSERMRFVRHLAEGGTVRFEALFSPEKPRGELIATFLAVLELLKSQMLEVIDSEGSFVFRTKGSG